MTNDRSFCWCCSGNEDQEHWQIVFGMTAGIQALGALVFIIFGSAEEQWWNRYPTREAAAAAAAKETEAAAKESEATTKF